MIASGSDSTPSGIPGITMSGAIEPRSPTGRLLDASPYDKNKDESGVKFGRPMDGSIKIIGP